MKIIKIRNKLLYIPAMSLLSTHPKELKSGISTPTFILALFKLAKMWKQHKCSLTDEWIKKMWHVHTIKYYLELKKKEILQ